jgi:sulfonate transport system permease protein
VSPRTAPREISRSAPAPAEPRTVTRDRTGPSRRVKVGVLQLVVLVAIIGVWELLVRARIVNSFTLAAPSSIAQQVVEWFADGSIWAHIGATMIKLGVGYVIGLVAGVVIGMLAGRMRFFRYYFDVFIIFLNTLPRLVLIPFFIILFGFGNLPGILVTALIVVFLVALNTRAAMDEIKGDFVLNARVLGANPLQLFRTVFLPGVALSVLASARLAIGLGFQAAVVAEFFGSPNGLGYLIAAGQQSYNPTKIYAAIVLTSILAFLLDLLLGRVAKRASRWLPER